MAQQMSESGTTSFNANEFEQNRNQKISDEEISIFRDIAFQIRHPDSKREVPWPSDCMPTKEVFGDELAFQYLYEWNDGNLHHRAIEVEVNAFIALEYTLSLEGTKECDIQSAFQMTSQDSQTLIIELQPFERECIVLLSFSANKDSKYEINGKWKQCAIDSRLYEQTITISNNE